MLNRNLPQKSVRTHGGEKGDKIFYKNNHHSIIHNLNWQRYQHFSPHLVNCSGLGVSFSFENISHMLHFLG